MLGHALCLDHITSSKVTIGTISTERLAEAQPAGRVIFGAWKLQASPITAEEEDLSMLQLIFKQQQQLLFQ